MADGEENEYSYSFGDGSCGSNTSLLKHAALSFFILSDPQGTTGLRAELDTATLGNGEHELRATAREWKSIRAWCRIGSSVFVVGVSGHPAGVAHNRWR